MPKIETKDTIPLGPGALYPDSGVQDTADVDAEYQDGKRVIGEILAAHVEGLTKKPLELGPEITAYSTAEWRAGVIRQIRGRLTAVRTSPKGEAQQDFYPTSGGRVLILWKSVFMSGQAARDAVDAEALKLIERLREGIAGVQHTLTVLRMESEQENSPK